MIHTRELSVYFAYWIVIILIFTELSPSRFALTTEIWVFQQDTETGQRPALRCHKHPILLSTWWNSLIAIYTFGVYQSFYTAQSLRTRYHGINNQGSYRRRYFATNTAVDRLGFLHNAESINYRACKQFVDQMPPLVRQHATIINIRKIGARVNQGSIKPCFNWLVQWPQALDLKWFPAED